VFWLVNLYSLLVYIEHNGGMNHLKIKWLRTLLPIHMTIEVNEYVGPDTKYVLFIRLLLGMTLFLQCAPFIVSPHTTAESESVQTQRDTFHAQGTRDTSTELRSVWTHLFFVTFVCLQKPERGGCRLSYHVVLSIFVGTSHELLKRFGKNE
jgi:hypothetical protein